MRRTPATLSGLGLGLGLVAWVAACGGPVVVDTASPDTSPDTTATTTSLPGAGGLSIVQLGDSIASGEGTLYGYRYDAHTQEWTGGDISVKWPGPYPLCHDSPDAYGNIVAGYFDADFHQFACTGATFAAGISAPETDRRREFSSHEAWRMPSYAVSLAVVV